MPHPRVVLVEGDPLERAELERVLRNEGFVVDIAASGPAALKMVQERRPDVVLTALRMPDMDGISLCSALHDLDANVPVIVVTAFSDTASAVRALRAGAQDYLTTPIDPEELLLSIQRALESSVTRIEREHLRERAEALYHEALAAVHARNEVLSIVSHDLRNPLGVIALRAKQLLELAGSGEHRVRAAEQGIAACILRCTQRMERLISDLLDESELRHGHLRLERRPHLLSDLLAEAADLGPLARQKRILLDIKPPARDGLLSCDRARVGQILGNLVSNAIKFSPERGVITVFAEPVEGGVRFAVRDAGPGISPHVLPLIFDRFWRPGGAGQPGVGLGLYIVKSLVEAHGGSAWVESKLGGGSTFSFIIPGELVTSGARP